MKVLIVEDELLIALDLESTVLDLGHEVIGPARNFGEAMELAREAEVALVDVHLPMASRVPRLRNAWPAPTE